MGQWISSSWAKGLMVVGAKSQIKGQIVRMGAQKKRDDGKIIARTGVLHIKLGSWAQQYNMGLIVDWYYVLIIWGEWTQSWNFSGWGAARHQNGMLGNHDILATQN